MPDVTPGVMPDDSQSGNLRHVIYDPDSDQLVTTNVFGSYQEAAEWAAELNDVLILPIPVPSSQVDNGSAGELDPEDGPCDCELPGYFCSGVPGIVARMESGRLAAGASVERCDLCQRFPSDEAARQRLVELGLA
jgi:hypothetical protein